MAKREESFLDVMAELPWWVSVIAAAVTYVGFRYVVPALGFNGPMELMIVDVLSTLAPLFVLALLAAAVVSAARGAARRGRLRKEQGARVAQGVGVCPKCGSELVLRSAKRGANAGGQFWGCASFPKCRYVKDFVG